MSEIKLCGRVGCAPVYIAKDKFIRCLHCGAAGGTDEEEQAVELWNQEVDASKDKSSWMKPAERHFK